jgi:hypothetical protein
VKYNREGKLQTGQQDRIKIHCELLLDVFWTNIPLGYKAWEAIVFRRCGKSKR